MYMIPSLPSIRLPRTHALPPIMAGSKVILSSNFMPYLLWFSAPPSLHPTPIPLRALFDWADYHVHLLPLLQFWANKLHPAARLHCRPDMLRLF